MSNLPDPNPLDLELGETMDSTYDILLNMPECLDSPDQLRLRIVAHNLRALADVLLIADSNEHININLKQVVLAMLGTSDWVLKNLPELPD